MFGLSGGDATYNNVNGNVAKTKIFQILYRREDVDIDDIFVFKIDFLVDILKVVESILFSILDSLQSLNDIAEGQIDF